MITGKKKGGITYADRAWHASVGLQGSDLDLGIGISLGDAPAYHRAASDSVTGITDGLESDDEKVALLSGAVSSDVLVQRVDEGDDLRIAVAVSVNLAKLVDHGGNSEESLALQLRVLK